MLQDSDLISLGNVSRRYAGKGFFKVRRGLFCVQELCKVSNSVLDLDGYSVEMK